MLTAKDRLILALDVDSLDEAMSLVEQTKEYVGVYKVGMQLYNSVGPKIVEVLHQQGVKVFVDLKFHDIPNTVAQAGAVMTRLGAFMYNVHAPGGKVMMETTMNKTSSTAEELGVEKPLVLGVTLLTSLDQEAVNNEIGLNETVEDAVLRYAYLAKQAGLAGVVASAKEIEALRRVCGQDFVLVIPGIRPAWASANDQKRITTPKEAIKMGATYIVVGRPITKADNPKEAAKLIVDEIQEGSDNVN